MKGHIFLVKRSINRSLRLVLMLIVVSAYTFAEGEGNEYNVKAMFVLNFMKYIEWPIDAQKSEFRIGVVGESEIFGALTDMTNNRQENRKIRIEHVNIDRQESYQILIIPRSENKRIEELIKKYQGKGVLIISEDCKVTNSFAINLVNINNKIRFEINNSQARLSGIKISSRLSDLAVSVQP